MGLLEAICIIYVRRLGPFHAASSPETHHHFETIREACTLIMLVAVAALAGIDARSRIGCFFFAFGLWDIFYYVGLKWLANWPSSLLAWDCLFLIPKPWYGPVLAPILISGYLITACCFQHWRETRGTPLQWSARVLLLQLAAGVVWYYSFTEHTEQILSVGFGGVTYSWSLFLVGVLLGVAGLWRAKRSSV